MDDCIFCKIISGDIPSTKVYEDNFVFAFRDLNPVAPTHVLVCPKIHISCVDDINDSNADQVANIFKAIPVIAKQEGLNSGYRVINNCKEDGGQSVMHMHFHLIGGKKLGEKII